MAQNVGRTSLVLATGTLVSRVLGFVKSIVLAQTIGLVGSTSADAFANANSLPTTIYSVIAAGLLNAVLVPQVVRAAKGSDGGQAFVNKLVTLSMCVLGVIATVATLASPALAWFYGITLSSEQLGLVVAFSYWCMPQVFFYALYAVLGEVLNARGRFAPFAWAPVLNNVVAIVGLVVFSQVFGADPYGTWGPEDWTGAKVAMLGGFSTLGVATQCLVLFLAWPRAGLRFRLDFDWRGTGLGRTGKIAAWTLGMVAWTQAAVWVETLVANRAFGEAASLAAMQNALTVFLLPHGIVAVSITTTLFTRMSEAAASGRTADVRRDFSGGARLITTFMVISGGGLIVIAPAFARVFESSQDGIAALAWVMSAYLVGLVPYSLLFYVQRVYYAYEDTRAIFLMYCWSTPIHALGMVLIGIFAPVSRITVGLALLSGGIATLRLAVIGLRLRRRLGGLDGHRLLQSTTRSVVAAVPALAAAAGIMALLGAYHAGGYARSSLTAALAASLAGGGCAIVLYVIALARLRSPELAEMTAPIRRRFRGTPGRHATDSARHASGTAGSQMFTTDFGTLVADTIEQPTAPIDLAGASGFGQSATSELPPRRAVPGPFPRRRDLRAREREREAREREREGREPGGRGDGPTAGE